MRSFGRHMWSRFTHVTSSIRQNRAILTKKSNRLICNECRNSKERPKSKKRQYEGDWGIQMYGGLQYVMWDATRWLAHMLDAVVRFGFPISSESRRGRCWNLRWDLYAARRARAVTNSGFCDDCARDASLFPRTETCQFLGIGHRLCGTHKNRMRRGAQWLECLCVLVSGRGWVCFCYAFNLYLNCIEVSVLMKFSRCRIYWRRKAHLRMKKSDTWGIRI